MASQSPACDSNFQKMFNRDFFQNGKQSSDEKSSQTAKTNIQNENGKQEESSQDTLQLNIRKCEGYDLLRPIRGARPDQVDNGNPELSKTSDKNLHPDSVITLSSEKAEMVKMEETATMLDMKTLRNFSVVEVRTAQTAHPLQEEVKPSTPCKTGQWQEEGQPTTTSRLRSTTKTQNAQAALKGEEPETKCHAKLQQFGCKEIAPSRKKNNHPIYCQENVAKRMPVIMPDHDFGKNLNVTVKTKAQLEGETKEKVKHTKFGSREFVPPRKKKIGLTSHQQNVGKRTSFTIPNLPFGTKLNVAVMCLALLFGDVPSVHAFKGPTNEVVKRGDRVVLTCFTDLGYRVKWFTNQKLFHTGYGFVTDADKEWCTIGEWPRGHYDLIIKNAHEKMAGFYTCKQVYDVKRVTANLIVLDVNCNTEETNVTTAVCTAVITGGNITSILWRIIDEDRIINATGAVTLNNSYTVDGIRRQAIRSELNLTGNHLHTNGVCRMTLVFNGTDGSAITRGPANQMADNTPTYMVEFPCKTNAKVPVIRDPVLTRITMGHTRYVLCMFGQVGLIVVVVSLMGVTILCDYWKHWTSTSPAADV